jgi:ABC-2 type transport system ATP-binding protein
MKKVAAIELEGVTYRYPGAQNPVFKDFSLQIEQGSFTGIVGPNGAGKSTLLNLMSGQLTPTSGRVSIALRKKHAIGYVPQDTALFPTLSALENLRFFGIAYGLSRQEALRSAREILERFALSDVAHKPVSSYSGGMKKRVNLAAAVVHKPEILFLDEPTAGIDIHSRMVVNDYLRELHRMGITILYTSHHLRETEWLCARIIILDAGRIIEDNPPEMLRKKYGETLSLEDIFLQITR